MKPELIVHFINSYSNHTRAKKIPCSRCRVSQATRNRRHHRKIRQDTRDVTALKEPPSRSLSDEDTDDTTHAGAE